MTLSTIEKQLARIEDRINTKPGGSVSLWIAGLLKSPKDNEVTIEAAHHLIQEGVLDAPEDHLWERMAARYEGNFEDMSNTQLWFLGARFDLEDEVFNDDDGKEALCFIARTYYEVFHHGAPLPENEQQRAWRAQELERRFLAPLLTRACPELEGYSHDTFTAWLKQITAAPKEPESSLASLREYVATFHKSPFTS